MRIHSLVALVVLGFMTTAPACAQKVVYLVRHAEKAGNDQISPLTTAGAQRAEALARHLKDAGITAIYTSDARRTQDTAAPIAKALKVKPEAVNNGDAATIFKKVTTDRPNEVILVVGHTDTVPDLIKLWGVTAPVEIKESEFDKLFVLVPTGPGKAGLARFRYQRNGP